MAVCEGELSYKIVCGMSTLESKLSPKTVCTLILQPGVDHSCCALCELVITQKTLGGKFSGGECSLS